MSVRCLDLFSGIGGMALGVHRVCPSARIWKMCDIDAACRELFARHFGPVEVCDDVRALRGSPAARVALVYGGFPCQDVSAAGKRAGVVRGERSSLFREMIRLGVECQAAYIFLENVAALEHNGLDEVVRCLTEAGWTEIRSVVCGADQVGGRHRRRRIFILAHNRRFRNSASRSLEISAAVQGTTSWIGDEPSDLPRLQPKHGPDAEWVNAIRMLGNSCVPQQAELALRFMLQGRGANPGGEGGGAAPALNWDEAWDQGEWNGGEDAELEEELEAELEPLPPPPAGPHSSPPVHLYKIMHRRVAAEMAPTLIAYDCFGGKNAHRNADGSYGSMTLAKWVRHNPDHGTWGTTLRRKREVVEGQVLSVPWATWFMGFPRGWL
jgi:site-specific DNA-cytosine methylase